MSELTQILGNEIMMHLSPTSSKASSRASSPASPRSHPPSLSGSSSSRSSNDFRAHSLPIEFTRFLDSAQFSDLTLRYEGKEAKVHKIMLCTQSKWFANACEGSFKEASGSSITLYDDDADAIDAMLQFCYGGTGMPHEDLTGSSRLTSLISIHAVADKYDVPGLRERAEDEFCAELGKDWMELWNSGDLSYVLIAVYACTPDPSLCKFCEIAVSLLRKHLDAMKGQDSQKLRVMMEENPELAADAVLRLGTSRVSPSMDNQTPPLDDYIEDGLGAVPIEQMMTSSEHPGAFAVLAASCGIRVL